MTVETFERYLKLVDLKIKENGPYGTFDNGRTTWTELLHNLYREYNRARGRKDREDGKGCRYSIGPYLEGYHDKSPARLYYVTQTQLEALNI